MSLYDKQGFDGAALDRWLTGELEEDWTEEYEAIINEGAEARKNGLQLNANPYTEKGEHKAWDYGWVDADMSLNADKYYPCKECGAITTAEICDECSIEIGEEIVDRKPCKHGISGPCGYCVTDEGTGYRPR